MALALSSKCYYPLEDLFCQALSHTKPEFVYSLYSIFQSYVIYREGKDPKLGSRAPQTHWIFSAGNAFAIGWSCIKLDQFMHQAFKRNSPESPPLLATATTAFLLVFPIMLASGVATTFLNMPNQTELQKKVPKEELERINQNSPWSSKKVDISWQRPWDQKLSQALQVSGLLLNIALSCTSKQRLPYLINATSHAYCLLKISEMKWLKYTAAFK